MTKYAKTMLELIETSRSHMTAEQVFHALRQVYPKVALATVYNNLNRLWEEGRIRKVSIEGMPDRSDRIQRHAHLVCPHSLSLPFKRMSTATVWVPKKQPLR